MRRTRHSRQDRGTQLVEFAIVLPMLLLMFFVVTEGTAMIRTHQVINNAAREGARLCSSPSGSLIYNATGSVRTNARNDIINQVKNYVSTNMKGYDATKLTVTISADEQQVTNPSTGSLMGTTVVQVSYVYTLKYLPVFSAGITSNTFTLRARPQFRNIYG